MTIAIWGCTCIQKKIRHTQIFVSHGSILQPGWGPRRPRCCEIWEAQDQAMPNRFLSSCCICHREVCLLKKRTRMSIQQIRYTNFSRLGNGDGSKPWYLVNIKIAGKWMFIPLKMVLIGIDPYLNVKRQPLKKSLRSEAPSFFSTISVFQVTLAHSLRWNNGQWLPIENLVWTQRQPRAPQQRKFLVQGLCCQIYAAKCW